LKWEELWLLLNQDRIQRQTWYRLLFLGHELGAVQKAFIYLTKYPEDYDAHCADMTKELGDLVAMIHMLCFSMNIKYEDIDALGRKGLMEVIARRIHSDR